MADDAGIQLNLDIHEQIHPLYMDIIKMEEAISNLLVNSIEAISGDSSHPGTNIGPNLKPAPKPNIKQAIQSAPVVDDSIEEKRISISLYTEGEEIVIAVQDTGPGFPDDKIDKLLDPYFTTKDEGTGLGLSISYRILTAHGGKLILENTLEHHARILITLPL
jgi:signal transduction histidine kinase